MQERLVSFEIAKLLKERGFNYIKPNCFGDNMAYQLPKGKLINANQGNCISGYILAPTLSLVEKWLREEFNIKISICYTYYQVKHKMMWHIYVLDKYDITRVNSYDEDYEKLLEDAILKILEEEELWKTK